ncbi:hypothetical protein MNBD_GAMMA12-3595 [hydrothermal vent metagenome]|uniref:Uncharacterized protein n=1 Tax=hydrothermal vent metagenome TaxID=652676 RepID=A0A3B0ZJQ9_9ZZZZ
MASILEEIPPDIIEIYSAEINTTTTSAKNKAKIEADLLERQSKINLTKVSTQKLNQVLLQMYNKESNIQSKTLAWAVPDLEKSWTQELVEYLATIDKHEIANDIISRIEQ